MYVSQNCTSANQSYGLPEENLPGEIDLPARALVFINNILERCLISTLRDLRNHIVSIVDIEITAETKP